MDREVDFGWTCDVMRADRAGRRHSAWALTYFCKMSYEDTILAVSHVEEMRERWYEFVAPEVPDEEP
jgi:hypothetical protein